MIVRKSKSSHVRTWFNKDGSLIPLFWEIKKRFPLAERQYFGGCWDGDGYHRNTRKKNSTKKYISINLEMAEDGCEPVFKLAELFDLSIYCRPKRNGIKYKNYQPAYTTGLSGMKAEIFLFFIYPHVIFRRPSIRKILLERGIPERLLKDPITFSWPYLAGFADAEATPVMKLRHAKIKNKIYSSYRANFTIPNNDFVSLTFIKNKIMEAGFKFRKDSIRHHNHVKVSKSMRARGANPKNWSPSKTIGVAGGPKELSRFYKNIIDFSLIKRKKDIMKKTMRYKSLFWRDET